MGENNKPVKVAVSILLYDKRSMIPLLFFGVDPGGSRAFGLSNQLIGTARHSQELQTSQT